MAENTTEERWLVPCAECAQKLEVTKPGILPTHKRLTLKASGGWGVTQCKGSGQMTSLVNWEKVEGQNG